MPDRLEEAKLTRLAAQRIRQLAEIAPDWPLPLDQDRRLDVPISSTGACWSRTSEIGSHGRASGRT
ncbi:hypothetical protein ACFTXM_49170, partial [Streptomyces sp. NPDC056930]|uniref:hypothetical protein n=1 Tax=Streptomyces sp. NPDC056930 TaxID=3345967 RepID=UPI003631D37C